MVNKNDKFIINDKFIVFKKIDKFIVAIKFIVRDKFYCHDKILSSTASRGGAQLTGKNIVNHGRGSWGQRAVFAGWLCRCFQTVFWAFPGGKGITNSSAFIRIGILVTVNHRSSKAFSFGDL